jgi:hypothetical protein
VTTADVNGDGRADLITANLTGNTVSVLLNISTPAASLDPASFLSASGRNTGLAVDATPPSVQNVTSSTANGTYKAGDVISIQVNLSEAVTVTGTPQLTLETGPTDRATNYISGSGTSTLTFSYTVQPGDTSADIDYQSTTALALNGGTIRDAAGNNAALTLPAPGAVGSLGGNKALVIDGVAPTATIVVADSTLTVGETSLVTITFSERVTGFTNADLTIANGTLSQVSSSNGGSTWTATLTPTANLTDATNLITLNTIGVQDGAGNSGSGATDSNNYAIDTARPTAGIVVADSTLIVGETSLVTITFSEAVTGFTNADLTIPNGTLSPVSSSNGGITWTATLTPAGNVEDSTNVITLDSTGISDVAGNAGSGATASNNYAIDTVNDAPMNTVPGTQAVGANTALAIAGLSVSDSDAGASAITTILSVAHGSLTVASAGGAAVAGSGTASVTLTGTVAAINTTLAAANNVVYAGQHDFFGADVLTVNTNDGGHTGSGGALADIDQVAITVGTIIAGTPGPDSFNAPAGTVRIDAGTGIDTITFGFKLVDATVSYLGNTIVIDGPGGGSHTVLTGFEVFSFTDGTVHNDDATPLIDDLFYYSKYHDVWNAHVDADSHFLSFGRNEGRDPSFFFSTVVYRSANPDVAASGVNLLDHFDGSGWLEGRLPSIHFDPVQYLAANPDVAAAHVDPLRHYLQFGYQEGRVPFAPTELVARNGFDYVYYLNHNPDVAASGIDPFQHFQTVGWKEGRNPNALFDTNGYLATYLDVKAANVNPLDHFNQFGWHEGRDPSVDFDTTSYLAAYADVNAAHVNPLTHFLDNGIHEGRSPFADGVWG